MKSSPRADVLVVDPEPVARLGLVTLLRSHEQLRVVGEAETLRTARQLCAKLKPNVVVLDPDVAAQFDSPKAVNRALREYLASRKSGKGAA